MTHEKKPFDAFLSHSHDDAGWVEDLARDLEDKCGFRIWLDKWVLVPGKSWQQEIERGLNEVSACAVCIGAKTPLGWFQQEIERALDRQARDQTFRVIPVLLPDASPECVPVFLSHRTWADFRNSQDHEYAFHVLKQGIKGEPVERWPPKSIDAPDDAFAKYEQKFLELKKFDVVVGGLHEEVKIEFQRKILDRWLDE